MCGRLSQYRGVHDFDATPSIPSALIYYTGDQRFERYNVAPVYATRPHEYLDATRTRFCLGTECRMQVISCQGWCRPPARGQRLLCTDS